MPSTTTNYGLHLYNSTTDQAESFLDYRSDMAGTAGTSNMNKIDVAMQDNADDITDLQAKKSIVNVPATYISANYYEATVSEITAYNTNDVIDLVLDTDSAGTVTLNINSLGTKSVMKINSSGTPVNLDNTNLLADRHYLFSYDGTRWVWINATSADQLDIGGTSGNFISIATDGSMEDSGSKAADFVADADFDANTILAADTDNTPAALTVAEQTLVGRIASGNIDALTATEVRTLLNVEDGADVTDATNVDAAGATMNADFDANTILSADTDNTPAALTVAEQTLVGRITSGVIAALTATQVRTLLNVEDGAQVNPPGKLFLSASGGWPSTTSGCGDPTKTEYATNDIDLWQMAFAESADSYAQWTVVMPSDWDAGTMTCVFYWTTASGDGGAGETVTFGLQGRSYANDDAIDQAWGTAQTVTDTWIADGDLHISSATSAITITGAGASELVQFRSLRDVSEDTLAASAQFIGAMLTYTRS